MDHFGQCLNCNADTNGRFCSSCGQRTNIPKITFKDVFIDFFSTIFNFYGPFPKTFLRLFSNPKEVIDGYTLGKRKTYYHPIRYLVVGLFISILFGEIVGFDPIVNQQAISGPPEANQGSVQGYQVGTFISKNLNYFTLLFPICIAVVSKLFFWRTHLNFAERTMMGFYLGGQYILLSIIPIALTLVSPYLLYLMYPTTVIYFTYTFTKVFLKKSLLKTILKAFFAALFSLVFYLIMAVILAYYIMYLFNLFE